jgi:hypothetical protein
MWLVSLLMNNNTKVAKQALEWILIVLAVSSALLIYILVFESRNYIQS